MRNGWAETVGGDTLRQSVLVNGVADVEPAAATGLVPAVFEVGRYFVFRSLMLHAHLEVFRFF